MPPISAAQVMRLLIAEAASTIRPSFKPRRCRIRLKTGCLATAATRPLISEKVMIPTVEKANPHSSAYPNVEPARAAKTSSLMSTKPPTAVMIPSVSSSGFKLVLDPLQRLGVDAQPLRGRVRRLGQQRPHLGSVRLTRLGQRRGRRLEIVMQPIMHRLHVCRGHPASVRLLIDQRPFRGDRPRLLDILKIGGWSRRATRD